MTSIVEDIVEILVSGISSFAQGFGEGIGELVKALFVNVSTTGDTTSYSLTLFGQLAIAFMAVSLAISLCRFVLTWVTTLGN